MLHSRWFGIASRFAGVLILQACIGCALSFGARADAGADPAWPPAPVPWPGDSRAALVVPDALWSAATDSAGFGSGSVGYTRDEMALYGRDAHRLRIVENSFRDVRAMMRLSGERTDALRDASGSPAQIVQIAYGLTDVSAGRFLPMPDSASWGAAWLPDARSPAAAIEDLLRFRDRGTPPDARTVAAWRTLPEPVQRLVLRLFVGAAEASDWLRPAFDEEFLVACLGAGGAEEIALDSLYAFIRSPWNEERSGQLAAPRREAFEALARVDRDYLCFGSVIFLTHLERALREFRSAGGADAPVAVAGFEFPTALGRVRILGPGADEVAEPAFLTVDLGGDDRYRGRQAVPVDLEHPISLVLDLAGSDRYEEPGQAVAMGCGLFGIGALVDLEGNDTYAILESGLGSGWYGTGLLVDAAGDDAYAVSGRWGQGTAHAGVGVLLDRGGADAYTCGSESQAMGSTLGAGILLDVEGNDRYTARDDGNVSELYLNQSVAMSQGVGYGRRADLGDGHSLAGGVGVLLDCAGDDLYHSQVWSQGAAYWWAIGILEDLGGNDRYENGKYSLGAGAHFAIGCQVDRAGNDSYNIGSVTAVNQYQGHARDGSIGISIDGDGDDAYLLKTHCAGSGDLAGIGVFWDRRGDDRYEIDARPSGDQAGWHDTPPMGSATVYPASRTFRDDLKACGIFLDTGGRDSYSGSAIPARESHRWRVIRGPVSIGFGADLDAYAE